VTCSIGIFFSFILKNQDGVLFTNTIAYKREESITAKNIDSFESMSDLEK
jgi:hypothetical protein